MKRLIPFILASVIAFPALAEEDCSELSLTNLVCGEWSYTENGRQSNAHNTAEDMMGSIAAALALKMFGLAAAEIDHYQQTRDIDKVEIIRTENEECDDTGICVTTVTVKTISHKRESE